MNRTEKILLVTLLLVTVSLICIILFYPPAKDRCMKAAKNEDWCVGSLHSDKDGSCLSDPSLSECYLEKKKNSNL